MDYDNFMKSINRDNEIDNYEDEGFNGSENTIIISDQKEELPKLEDSNLVINNNREIIVPRDIRFISDWKDYSLELFQFPHILDKKIPGCGYTEYCLRSSLPIILCSPRKILLENKEEQHRGKVFYFKNELESDLEMDKDLTKVFKTSNNSDKIDLDKESKRKEIYKKLKADLQKYLINCFFVDNVVPKILVTYDSFRLVKEIVKGTGFFSKFYVVVDEFQSIFTDSRFKSTTEMEFVDQLRGMQKVCFVSATPMIDRYLAKLNDFKDLPYYELDWVTEDPNRAITPDLKVRVVSSITTRANEIIQTYKVGNFEKSTDIDNSGSVNIIESKEAVFYVNSVNNIISIINKAKLTPEECNILCAKTDNNLKRIKTRLPKGFEIGRVPLKGEPHKMFTFCTRTVYLGADFYSTNARSFILSDANSECLAVDISLDLPQILGRQRDLSNPWKNRAEFYYKTLSKNKGRSQEEFKELMETKQKKTEDLLSAYKTCSDDAKQTLAEKYLRDAKNSNYKFDYVAVNEHGGSDLKPEYNDLVVVAEQRAFDIQQVDYKDRFSVFNTITSEGMIEENSASQIRLFLQTFNECKDFSFKMRMLCEIDANEIERGILLDQVPLMYKNYYQTLGPERLHALGYNKTYVDKEYSDLQFNISDLEEEVYKTFKEGCKYTKSEVKETLAKLYKSLGYNKTAKANDLEKYFDIKECKISNPDTGKREHGFELLAKKKENKEGDT